jgi:hypothetical protein
LQKLNKEIRENVSGGEIAATKGAFDDATKGAFGNPYFSKVPLVEQGKEHTSRYPYYLIVKSAFSSERYG